MTADGNEPRRVRVERNIYRRPTGVLEIGFKDASGIQRWRTVDGGVMAARKLRDDLLARRGRGETVAPDSRLRFGEAADVWLAGPVLDLRETTQAGYRSAVEQHLRRKFGNRRLDGITPDDLAALVRSMREQDKSEATIAAVLGAVGRIYKFAARRLGFTGMNPITLMLSSERPKVSQATRRPIFTPEQIEQTLAAATEPYRTLFTVAALTGARLSELCGLTWANVCLDDLDDAEITFAWQVDRKGNRRPTKTDGSARTVPIPRELALVLVRHKLASRGVSLEAFVSLRRSCSPLVRGAPDPSGTLRGHCEKHSNARRTSTANRPSRSSIRAARFPPASCPRCTRSVTRSPPGPCSPARALMKSRSCSGIATPQSPGSSTSTRSPTPADARRRHMRRSRMTAEYAGALRIALQSEADDRST